MNELQPGKHYRNVRFGDVVMPVAVAMGEMTSRKFVVYTEKGTLGESVWILPLEIFERRYELVEEGKELRPIAGFPEFKPVLDPKKLLAENEELKLQINSLRYEMSKMEEELMQLKSDNQMLKRRIADLRYKDDTSEVPF